MERKGWQWSPINSKTCALRVIKSSWTCANMARETKMLSIWTHWINMGGVFGAISFMCKNHVVFLQMPFWSPYELLFFLSWDCYFMWEDIDNRDNTTCVCALTNNCTSLELLVKKLLVPHNMHVARACFCYWVINNLLNMIARRKQYMCQFILAN